MGGSQGGASEAGPAERARRWARRSELGEPGGERGGQGPVEASEAGRFPGS